MANFKVQGQGLATRADFALIEQQQLFTPK